MHNEAAFYTDFDTTPFIECKSCAFTHWLTDKMCQSVSYQRMCQYFFMIVAWHIRGTIKKFSA